MDTKRIIEMHINALDGEKEELRKKFLAELDSLGSEAKSAAQHASTALPTLAWIETSLARVRELREAFEKAECGRDILRRVSEAAEFEARKNATA